ncbi:hypothetical protein WOSG25_041300 [Weissella oryzae SG25]|uniref:ABM domain-containing protein n=1 Tax=Weissella oryzae (strain DSM 25784 / JCM 18191 / LMG 30913 / SG25) TaxID=1329250 RepID=A0A069CS91_WEIOS|nr:antibiotic biosynthesis monooxygenase [Weissella oryzae]GAK30690.1 hypothetical protein WOSG25_041300 [Weissella oryzae SG25]
MTRYIHTTFGTREVLSEVRNKHLDRPIHLSVEDGDQSRAQLIELTDDPKSVFTVPTSYKVISSAGDDSELRGWMMFTFITLNDQERDNFIRRYDAFLKQGNLHGGLSSFLLQRTNNDHQLVLLSTWKSKDQWQNWSEESDFPMRRYEGPNASYNLRRVGYSFKAFSKSSLN